MRALIVGGGSIGTRHLRNLRELGVDSLAVIEPNVQRRQVLCEHGSVMGFDALEQGLQWKPALVVIATPSHLHLDQALASARAGCHLFIEKPLSHTLDGVEELSEIVQRKNLITLVGCNMRFHHGPATIKQLLDDGVIGKVISATLDAGQYLPDWHPGQDYRQWYSAHRSMGGGVVLDGIHEIDYARWLFGEVLEVFCYGGRASSLDIDVEDTANILMKVESGISVMIHIDYLQRAYSRSCKVIGEDGTITWDITAQLRWFSAQTKQWSILEPPEDYTINDMYVQEMRHFLDCVEQGKKTMLDVNEAARVTRIALAIKQSMGAGEKVTV